MLWCSVDLPAHGIDWHAAQRVFEQHAADSGACVAFVGRVRGDVRAGSGDVRVRALWIEHVAQLTEASVHEIVQVAQRRYGVTAVQVIHRVGEVALGETIVSVQVCCAHRGQAFSACQMIMDGIKTQAVFWKRTLWDDGESTWVEPNPQDAQQMDRWLVDNAR